MEEPPIVLSIATAASELPGIARAAILDNTVTITFFNSILFVETVTKLGIVPREIV